MKVKAVIFIISFLLTSSSISLLAQDSTSLSFLSKLEGHWQSTGKAFGMVAEIMLDCKRTLGDKFLKLSYKMDMKTKEGQTQTFEGVAFYKETQKNEYVATWFDSGGEMHPIKASSDANSLTAIWGTPETKLGKTIYSFLSDNQVEITDFIQTQKGEWKQFNKNTLARKNN